jgi:hypothetical protein
MIPGSIPGKFKLSSIPGCVPGDPGKSLTEPTASRGARS